MRRRPHFLAACWVRAGSCFMACALALGCGGGGGGDDEPLPLVLSFECMDAAVAADTVALACGAVSQSTVREVQVVIGGPTASSDIMGFSFDVVFDPVNLSYVAGSAGQGTLLNSDGDDPLLAVEVASNDPGRLLVGIHRTDQASGVGGTGARSLVVRFSLRANVLVAFGPELLRFENAEAVDSSGSAIPGITFSDQLLLSVD